MHKTKAAKGFTIIEVVLVLAIAGLIFLMVFIALPALQRSQRNTQRRNDMSRFITAISNYQSNNSNNNPFIGTANESAGLFGEPTKQQLTNFIKRYVDTSCQDYANKFNKTSEGAKSMVFGTTACGSEFTDPDGTPYGLDIRLDKEIQGAGNDEVNSHFVKFPQDETGTKDYASTVNNVTHIFTVFSKAKCGAQEGVVISTSGKNDVAVFYVLEGGSITCADNQ